MHTIKSLRQSGFKIRVNHFRKLKCAKGLFSLYAIRQYKRQKEINPLGGKTVLEVTAKDGKDFEVSVTCYAKDAFNKHIALSESVKRLIPQLAAHNYIID